MNYLDARKMVDESTKKVTRIVEYILIVISSFTLIYGFISYLIYQKREYKDKFSWTLFFLGGHKCKNIHRKNYMRKHIKHIKI